MSSPPPWIRCENFSPTACCVVFFWNTGPDVSCTKFKMFCNLKQNQCTNSEYAYPDKAKFELLCSYYDQNHYNMGQACDWEQYISFCLSLAHEVILTLSTAGLQTNKQHWLNKQSAYSVTHEVYVGQGSQKTTNSGVTVHIKHMLPTKHAAETSYRDWDFFRLCKLALCYVSKLSEIRHQGLQQHKVERLLSDRCLFSQNTQCD